MLNKSSFSVPEKKTGFGGMDLTLSFFSKYIFHFEVEISILHLNKVLDVGQNAHFEFLWRTSCDVGLRE